MQNITPVRLNSKALKAALNTVAAACPWHRDPVLRNAVLEAGANGDFRLFGCDGVDAIEVGAIEQPILSTLVPAREFITTLDDLASEHVWLYRTETALAVEGDVDAFEFVAPPLADYAIGPLPQPARWYELSNAQLLTALKQLLNQDTRELHLKVQAPDSLLLVAVDDEDYYVAKVGLRCREGVQPDLSVSMQAETAALVRNLAHMKGLCRFAVGQDGGVIWKMGRGTLYATVLEDITPRWPAIERQCAAVNAVMCA